MGDAVPEKEDSTEKKGFSFHNLYVSIRRWFQPYYQDTRVKSAKKSHGKKSRKKKSLSKSQQPTFVPVKICLLYTSDAADE